MTSGDAITYIGIPLLIFVLGAFGSGVMLLIRGSAYMARSGVAQETAAHQLAELNATLKAYIAGNDVRFNDLDRRVFAMEDWRRGEERADHG